MKVVIEATTERLVVCKQRTEIDGDEILFLGEEERVADVEPGKRWEVTVPNSYVLIVHPAHRDDASTA